MGLIVAVLALTGCLLPATRFELTLSGSGVIDDLPVTVEDRSGQVDAVAPALPGQLNFREGVTPGDVPSDLVVSWLGGACDLGTHLVVAAAGDGYTITEHTERADTCRSQAVLRTVTLRLETPVDPALVQLDAEQDR